MAEVHIQALHDLLTTTAMSFGEMAIDMQKRFDTELMPQLQAIAEADKARRDTREQELSD